MQRITLGNYYRCRRKYKMSCCFVSNLDEALVWVPVGAILIAVTACGASSLRPSAYPEPVSKASPRHPV